MKRESKLWQLVKKKTPKIQWTRLESWSSFGTPDLLGYHENCGFFMVELKVAQQGSPSRINLYGSSSLPDLLADYKSTQPLASNDWDHIQRLLIRAPLDS
jgi:hypothetical protein